MALVAGSYEKFIWGFSLKTLTPLFSYPSHTAPIKCAAAEGPLAASGGADDAVHIYHLPSSSDAGSLLDHSAAVTSLSFFCAPSTSSIPRNLISGSDDGVVRIFDADPFVLLKEVKAHKKGGVADLAVHPSGRVALTVGRGDSSLVMVNLVRGRRSFSCRIEKEASVVKYGGESGDWFAMASEGRITVHDSEDARIIQEIDCGKRILCVAHGESGTLYTGGEDHHVTAWDTKSGKKAFCIPDAHKNRVKGLVSFKVESPKLIASASSDGVIRVWDVNMASTTDKWTPLLETDTKSRLTCLAGTSIR
ncbi:uncharacterized protein LOC144572506 [Carex rostrata]